MPKLVGHAHTNAGCSLLNQMSARYIFISTFWTHLNVGIFQQFIFACVWYVMPGCNLAVATNSTKSGVGGMSVLFYVGSRQIGSFLAVNFFYVPLHVASFPADVH